MAFETKLHYQVRQIAPRHFFQTAAKAKVAKSEVQSIVEELRDIALIKVESAISTLPPDFPENIPISIEAGMKGRLKFLKDFKIVGNENAAFGKDRS